MSINETKYYHLALALFLLLGAFVTAHQLAEGVLNRPDMSWQNPDTYAATINNYLQQKVTPSTMADVLVTEYYSHPREATGVIPLFLAQRDPNTVNYGSCFL